MCVIVFQHPGAELSGNKFRNCWNKNQDGGGYAFAEDGKVIIKKGFFKLKPMLEQYRQDLEAHPESPFLIHFRISTSGKVNSLNTHPHRISDTLALGHNGHITGWGNDKKSDTLEFAIKVLSQLPDGWEGNEAILELLEGYLGFDKMVLLTGDGDYAIVNESRGYWQNDDTLWFSNRSFDKPVVSSVRTVKGPPYVPAAAEGKYTKPRKGGDINPTKSGTQLPISPPITHQSAIATIAGTKKNTSVTSVVGGEEFVGQSCWACVKPLDGFDAECCNELGAWEPMCFDCMMDDGLSTEAYDTGLLLRPVTYLDVVTEGQVLPDPKEVQANE